MLPLGTRSPVPTSRRSSRAPATKRPPRAGLEERRGKSDDTGVVQRRAANLVHGAADPEQPVASAATRCKRCHPEVQHIERVAAAAHAGDEGQLVIVVERRRMETRPEPPPGSPGASSPASAIACSPCDPGRKSPRWRVRRRYSRQKHYALPRSTTAADALRTPQACRRPAPSPNAASFVIWAPSAMKIPSRAGERSTVA